MVRAAQAFPQILLVLVRRIRLINTKLVGEQPAEVLRNLRTLRTYSCRQLEFRGAQDHLSAVRDDVTVYPECNDQNQRFSYMYLVRPKKRLSILRTVYRILRSRSYNPLRLGGGLLTY